MQFSNIVDALLNIFPWVVVSYLWHNVLHLTASLVGAIIISKSVHHLFILELVPVRHWKITQDKLSLAEFQCLSKQTAITLLKATLMRNFKPKVPHYIPSQQKTPVWTFVSNTQVKCVKRGSIDWPQMAWIQGFCCFPQSWRKMLHKTKCTICSTMTDTQI